MRLGDNVATPVTTMVGVGNESPPNVGDENFRPSSKGQPNEIGHSNGEHKWWSQQPSNLEKARMNGGWTKGEGKPLKQLILAMTTPTRGPWIGHLGWLGTLLGTWWCQVCFRWH